MADGALSWLTFNLGHVLAALPPQKRALHDYVAGTRVVQARALPGERAPRLPGWAWAWIAWQAVTLLVLTAWAALRAIAALRAAVAPG